MCIVLWSPHIRLQRRPLRATRSVVVVFLVDVVTVPQLVSVEFVVRGIPPSKNHRSVKGVHWATANRLKREWMWRFMRALDELDLDRPIRKTGKLLVYAEVTERKRTRLEMENVRPALAECLLDALWRDSMMVDGARIVGGWIRHDSDDEVELVSVRKSPVVGVEQTRVKLVWEPLTPVG